jgi:hypothetical protein
VFACLASLLLASRGEAAVILVIGQTSPNNTITLTNNGAGGNVAGSETLTGTNVAVLITASFNNIIAPGTPAFLNLSASNTGTPATIAFPNISEQFAGTFSITSLPGGGGTNFLSGTFMDAFSGVLGATGAAAVTVGSPPESITFTSGVGLPTDPPKGVAFSFTDLAPPLAFTGISGVNASVGGLGETTMSVAGDFNAAQAAVPESSTLLLSSLVGLGFIGYGLTQRRKARGE